MTSLGLSLVLQDQTSRVHPLIIFISHQTLCYLLTMDGKNSKISEAQIIKK